MADQEKTIAETEAYHIFFIGFMGAGKSTVARKLAAMFNRRFIDLDNLISRKAHKKIPEIFEQEGEEGFRFRETAALETMADETPAIVSCGGGIVMRPENIELLHRLGTVVYLQVSAEQAIARISDPSSRPLLTGAVPVKDLLALRRPLYEQAANIVVDTEGKSPDDVVTEVGELLWLQGLL